MIKKEKCIEYYFDSKKYNQIQIIEKMEKEKLEFPKEQVEVKMYLNQHGIYVAQLVFLNNGISIIQDKILDKIKKHIKRDEQVCDEDSKTYGQYKINKTYSPI